MFPMGRPSIQTTRGPAHRRCLQGLSLDPQELPQPLAMMSYFGIRPRVKGTRDYGLNSLKLWAQNRFFLLFLNGLRYFVLETSTFLSFRLSLLIPGNRAQEQPAFLTSSLSFPIPALRGVPFSAFSNSGNLPEKLLAFFGLLFPSLTFVLALNCEPLNEGHGYVHGSAFWNSGCSEHLCRVKKRMWREF